MTEIEFNRLNDTEMEKDRPGTEQNQQQEHVIHDRATSELSSIDGIPELEDIPEQEPQSRPTMDLVSTYESPLIHRLKEILAIMQAVLSCIHHHI